MPISISSNTAGVVVNIVFGLIAALIGIVTAIQGYKAYRMWEAHGRVRDQEEHGPSEQGNPRIRLNMSLTATSDIELDHRTSSASN